MLSQIDDISPCYRHRLTGYGEQCMELAKLYSWGRYGLLLLLYLLSKQLLLELFGGLSNMTSKETGEIPWVFEA